MAKIKAARIRNQVVWKKEGGIVNFTDGSRFVPDAIVVRRDDFEGVGPGFEVGVEGLPACSGVFPILVQTHELIAEAIPLRAG